MLINHIPLDSRSLLTLQSIAQTFDPQTNEVTILMRNANSFDVEATVESYTILGVACIVDEEDNYTVLRSGMSTLFCTDDGWLLWCIESRSLGDIVLRVSVESLFAFPAMLSSILNDKD